MSTMPSPDEVDGSPVVFTMKVHLVGADDSGHTMLATSADVDEHGLSVHQMVVVLDVITAGARALRRRVCERFELYGEDAEITTRILGIVEAPTEHGEKGEG